LYVLLSMIADWAWRKYRVVHDRRGRDVQDVVGDALRRKITTLKNPRQVSWRAVLKSWCYTVAKYHCLNVLRDERRADADLDRDVLEDTGGKSYPPYRTEAEEQEQESVKESRIAKIDWTVREVFESLTPEEKAIVLLWAKQRMTLKQIAEETGSSIATVARKLKKIQKAFVDGVGKTAEVIGEESDAEVAVTEVQESLLAHCAKDLRELVAAGLHATAGLERRPEACA
jgi:RNA polymerase sigma factor (sigma-70 family)